MTYSIPEWISDLRSGKFKQAKHVLYDVDTDGYCCLGVAAYGMGFDFSGIDGPDDYVTCHNEEWGNGNLPDYSFWQFHIDDYNVVGDIFSETVMNDLASMNDGGKTFDEIADHIEKIWKEGLENYENY